jgi:hypothetical protein
VGSPPAHRVAYHASKWRCLTIHSSRRCFAARLNSNVRRKRESLMRVILRVIAAILALLVLQTLIVGVVEFAGRRAFPEILRSPVGALAVLGWVITLIAGSIGVILLCKLHRIGRIAALIVFGYGALYYSAVALIFGKPDTQWSRIPSLFLFNFSVLVVLALPAAKRACYSKTDVEKGANVL